MNVVSHSEKYDCRCDADYEYKYLYHKFMYSSFDGQDFHHDAKRGHQSRQHFSPFVLSMTCVEDVHTCVFHAKKISTLLVLRSFFILLLVSEYPKVSTTLGKRLSLYSFLRKVTSVQFFQIFLVSIQKRYHDLVHRSIPRIHVSTEWEVEPRIYMYGSSVYQEDCPSQESPTTSPNVCVKVFSRRIGCSNISSVG